MAGQCDQLTEGGVVVDGFVETAASQTIGHLGRSVSVVRYQSRPGRHITEGQDGLFTTGRSVRINLIHSGRFPRIEESNFSAGSQHVLGQLPRFIS